LQAKSGTKFPPIPAATISIVLITSFLFYSWSGGFLSSPPLSIPREYGFSIYAPLTYLTYPFVHLWPLHLFANVFFVLVFGSFVERELGTRKFLLFYLLSAAIVGIISQATDFVSGSQFATIVGASGVAFALVGAALVLKPARTIAIFLLLSYFVVPFFLSAGISQAQQRVIEESTTQINAIEQNKTRAVIQLERGELTPLEFNRTVSVMEAQRRQESEKQAKIESAKLRESTPVAESAHASAPFAGAILMLFFRPSSLGEWAERGRWIEGKIRGVQKSIYKQKRNQTL